MKKYFFILILLLSLSKVRSQITDSSYCEQIENVVDEFDGHKTYRTPLSKKCAIEKVIQKGVATYYLSLRSLGVSVSVHEKGVKIILSNKQILSFPNERIDVEVDEKGGFDYSAFIILTSANIQLLKKYKILKWRLYIYDDFQYEEEAEALRNMINCMSNLK